MLENARQIVRSVNAYDELVKALVGCIKAAHEAKDQLNRASRARPALLSRPRRPGTHFATQG
jgi:hypothetical protein